MPKRSALFVFVGLCLALLIVGTATGVVAGGRADLSVILRLHAHTPVLLLVDCCALLIFFGFSVFGALYTRLAEEQKSQTIAQSRQLSIMMERTAELARLNDEYTGQIGALETAAQARQAEFDSEMRRLVEQSYFALSGQVDAQTKQLEAVSIALQYQHAELQDVAQAVKDLQEKESDVSRILAQAPLQLTSDPPGSSPLQIHETDESPALRDGCGSFVDLTQNDRATQVVSSLDFDVASSEITADAKDYPAPEPTYFSDHQVHWDKPPPLLEPQEPATTSAKRYFADLEDASSAPQTPNEEDASLLPALPLTPDDPDVLRIAVKLQSDTQHFENVAGFEVPFDVPVESDTTESMAANAAAMDTAEEALSTLMIEAQEALSSLRAQVEAASEEGESLLTPPFQGAATTERESRTRPRRWYLPF